MPEKYYLRELRARKRMTQAQVAKELGVSPQTYCAWERDLTGVAIGKMLVIADFFECPIDKIFLKYDFN